MISRISGILNKVTDAYALVENHGVFYELLVPSGLAERLKQNGRIGHEVTFETIYYIEAGDRKSNHYPKMVGFIDPVDREFFSLFTQVPGLGIKKALKCLILPIKDIAAAIETRDSGTLNRLPGVGGRLAEKIIAELNGKTEKYALARTSEPLTKKDSNRKTEPFEEEAMEVLLQLQYKSQEAKEMIQAAVKANPKIKQVEELISDIFKNTIKSGDQQNK